ncbi:TOBE domain-containing protein [Undibacterium sp. SXout11W]|uniref:TOBE domain-containing protein n=1 Tax=Undibacterium sp. SXout11W TaxID=3413050 RepID=UPI003BF01F04
MNQLTGLIAGVEAHGSVALVDVSAEGGLRLSATLLGHPDQLATWRLTQPVRVLFKETEVALAKNLQGQISLRNRIPGVILTIEKGQILTRVVIAVHGLKDVTISSVITTRSATHLNLAIGDMVEALVKSNEMTIQALSDTEI